MKQPNERYTPLQVEIEDSPTYFSGSYIYNKEDRVFEISGFELPGFSIPSDHVDIHYVMKKLGSEWQIAKRPETGGTFLALHTQMTDKIMEAILQKHEFFNRIIYPNPSHPYA